MSQLQFKKSSARPAGPDLYALLGLEEQFAIDLARLERHYLERSRNVHPDRFVNADARERVNALQQSMQLNDAYKTLKQPLARAEYLLGRHGLSIDSNEKLDPAFLMEVLELREELQEAKMAGQKETLRRLEGAMRDRRDDTLSTIGTRFLAFEQSGDRSGDQSLLADIKKQVILLRYIQRYLEEFEDDFDDGNDV